jgi:hypothetical protein
VQQFVSSIMLAKEQPLARLVQKSVVVDVSLGNKKELVALVLVRFVLHCGVVVV